MYKAKNCMNESQEHFDWEGFFSRESTVKIVEKMDTRQMISTLREQLRDNRFKMVFSLSKVLRNLLRDVDLKKDLKILELGAATGLLTRWLISQYGGTGVMVDNCEASYRAFIAIQDNSKKYIRYLNEDIFTLKLDERFDVVCSFGLIEHFADKRDVLAVHKEYVTPGGIILIFVPLDTLLSRVFLEVHPELNLGYRELLTETELYEVLMKNGMEVMRVEMSSGYCYDFVGAVCCLNAAENHLKRKRWNQPEETE